jgi:hypothetical protein
MSLDQSKLVNAKKAADGKITAQCPACAAAGSDTKGGHLVIFPDGAYGCVANEGDKNHSKEIFKLAGVPRIVPVSKIVVRTIEIPPSRLVLDLGSIKRFAQPQIMPTTPGPSSTPHIAPSAEASTDIVVEAMAAEPRMNDPMRWRSKELPM